MLWMGGCAIKGQIISAEKDIWFQDEHQGLLYCRAYGFNNGTANPTCFRAGTARKIRVDDEIQESETETLKPAKKIP